MDDGRPYHPASARHRAHSRPGRPHAVLVRLSVEEKQLIDAAAQAAGLTPTGYAGKAAVEAAAAEKAPTGVPRDLRDLQHELFAARRAINLFGRNVDQAAAFHAGSELPDWVGEAVRLCADAVARLDKVTAEIDRRLR